VETGAAVPGYSNGLAACVVVSCLGLAERNLLSGIGDGEGGVGHGEVGWVGVCPGNPDEAKALVAYIQNVRQTRESLEGAQTAGVVVAPPVRPAPVVTQAPVTALANP
jgi:hypothetical protein